MVVLGRLKHYHSWLLCDLVSNFVVLCGLSTHLRSVDLIVSVQRIEQPGGLRAPLILSHCSGQNLVMNVSKSLDGLPWSCNVIMLVLCSN